MDSIELQIDRSKSPTTACQSKGGEKKKKWLSAECEGTFYDNARTVLLGAFENCFVSQHSVPAAPLLSPHPPESLRRRSRGEPLAGNGDDGTGWIFNRFVLGSTMGGGIVVNIITYRSLQLYFPRPCRTEAITHSTPTPTLPPPPAPAPHPLNTHVQQTCISPPSQTFD